MALMPSLHFINDVHSHCQYLLCFATNDNHVHFLQGLHKRTFVLFRFVKVKPSWGAKLLTACFIRSHEAVELASYVL